MGILTVLNSEAALPKRCHQDPFEDSDQIYHCPDPAHDGEIRSDQYSDQEL